MIKSRLKNKSIKLNESKKEKKSKTRGRPVKIVTGYTHLGELPDVDEDGFHIVRLSKDRLRIRQRSVDRAMSIMKGFGDMRKNGVMLDLFIKVGDQSFGLHRTIAAACSDYFQDIIERMRDTKEKTFEMTDVDPKSVKLCIDFMYTGQLSLEKEGLKGVLKVATIMKLTNLVHSCFSHISRLSEKPNDCVEMAQLLQLFPDKDTEDTVKEHFRNNFEDVSKTRYFCNLSCDAVVDLLNHYSADDDNSLQGILEWIRYKKDERSCYLEKLVDVMHFKKFPSDQVLTLIIREPAINSFEPSLKKLVGRIFSDIPQLKNNLRPTNCFSLRQLTKLCADIQEQADPIILEYMGLHLDQVSVQTTFILLNINEVLKIFETSANTEFLSSERFKWDAIVKWVNFSSERKKIVPVLLKAIHFNEISYSNSLKISPMVRDSPECLDIITTSFRTPKKKYDKYFTVLLPNEDLCLFNPSDKAWGLVPKISDEKILEIFSLNNKLCAITENAIFYFKNDTGWIRRTEINFDNVLTHATRITSSKDFAIFVEKNTLSYYNCLKDKWHYDMPGCELENFSVAVLGNSIFAFGIDGAKRYRMTQLIWEDITCIDGINPGSSVATMKDNIYIIGLDHQKAMIYDPSTDTCQYIKDLPIANIIQTCAFVYYRKLYAVVKVSSSEMLLMYDELQDQWLIHTRVIPKNKDSCNEFLVSTYDFFPVRGFGSTSPKEPKGRKMSKSAKAAMQSNPTGGLFVTPHNIVYESKPSPKHKLATVMSACTFMTKEGSMVFSAVRPA